MRALHAAAALSVTVLLAAAPAASAGHLHHKRCVPCCCPPAAAPAPREAEPPRFRAAEPVVRAAVVPSMPMYTMPMMYAPVMPAMAVQPTRGAEFRGPTDCCERVDRLELEMTKLAQSVRELQSVVQGQTEVLKILAARQPATPRDVEAVPIPPLKPLPQ